MSVQARCRQKSSRPSSIARVRNGATGSTARAGRLEGVRCRLDDRPDLSVEGKAEPAIHHQAEAKPPDVRGQVEPGKLLKRQAHGVARRQAARARAS